MHILHYSYRVSQNERHWDTTTMLLQILRALPENDVKGFVKQTHHSVKAVWERTYLKSNEKDVDNVEDQIRKHNNEFKLNPSTISLTSMTFFPFSLKHE
jgi:hypothetical protein